MKLLVTKLCVKDLKSLLGVVKDLFNCQSDFNVDFSLKKVILPLVEV